MSSHDQNCDIFDSPPEFAGESRKPCNCRAAEIGMLTAKLKIAEEALRYTKDVLREDGRLITVARIADALAAMGKVGV